MKASVTTGLLFASVLALSACSQHESDTTPSPGASDHAASTQAPPAPMAPAAMPPSAATAQTPAPATTAGGSANGSGG